MTTTGQRGQAMPITVLLVAFVLLVALGVARLAREVSLRAAAQHAADATALAGAVDGEGSAAEIAAHNDATLVRFEQDGDIVTVEVLRRGARARARAEFVVALASSRDSSPLPVGGG